MSKHHRIVRAIVRGGRLSGLFTALLLPAGLALAGETEPLAVIELGAATEWGLKAAAPALGQRRRSNSRRSRIGSK
jgi:hypothetical protein